MLYDMPLREQDAGKRAADGLHAAKKIPGGIRRNQFIMKYVREVLIVIAFTFVGELLNALLPLPVPAGVYGLFLLLIALVSGVIKLEDVETTGNFLLDTMTMMFIPAAVAIMNSVDVLMPVLVPYILIIVISTILVLSVTGLTAQGILKHTESASSEEAEEQEPVVEMTTGIASLEGERKVPAYEAETHAHKAETAFAKRARIYSDESENGGWERAADSAAVSMEAVTRSTDNSEEGKA